MKVPVTASVVALAAATSALPLESRKPHHSDALTSKPCTDTLSRPSQATGTLSPPPNATANPHSSSLSLPISAYSSGVVSGSMTSRSSTTSLRSPSSTPSSSSQPTSTSGTISPHTIRIIAGVIVSAAVVTAAFQIPFERAEAANAERAQPELLPAGDRPDRENLHENPPAGPPRLGDHEALGNESFPLRTLPRASSPLHSSSDQSDGEPAYEMPAGLSDAGLRAQLAQRQRG
jgi:hypothetical protein